MSILSRGQHRSGTVWESTKLWAQANPGKTAAIITPEGTFRVTFEPAPPPQAEPVRPPTFVDEFSKDIDHILDLFYRPRRP